MHVPLQKKTVCFSRFLQISSSCALQVVVLELFFRHRCCITSYVALQLVTSHSIVDQVVGAASHLRPQALMVHSKTPQFMPLLWSATAEKRLSYELLASQDLMETPSMVASMAGLVATIFRGATCMPARSKLLEGRQRQRSRRGNETQKTAVAHGTGRDKVNRVEVAPSGPSLLACGHS
jgi:hypothetical protein